MEVKVQIENGMTVEERLAELMGKFKLNTASEPSQNGQEMSENIDTLKIKALAIYVHTTTSEQHILIATKYPEYIKTTRNSLLSPNPIQRKQALFVLKSLTSALATTKNYFENVGEITDTELLLDLGHTSYLKFWTDFFEIFEILDETQVHIIEPFLNKLTKLLDSCSTSVKFLQWYFILLKKMTQHENRSIVERGILDFFKARQLLTPNNKEDFTEFITTSVLPAVKKNVGWIFPDAPNFFSASNNMGILLYEKYSMDVYSVTELVLGFIQNCGNGSSPLSILFFLGSVRSCLELLLLHGQAVISEPDFVKCILIINDILLKCLTTIDKFIGCQIQKCILDIFLHLFRLRQGNTCATVIILFILEFVGLLDRETVVTHSSVISAALSTEFTDTFKCQGQDEIIYTKIQKVGYYRILFVIYDSSAKKQDQNITAAAVLTTFPFKALTALPDSSSELLRCILLLGVNSKSDYYQELWKTIMRNSILECLIYWNPASDPNNQINSSDVLEIQELILQYPFDFNPGVNRELDLPFKNFIEIISSRTLGTNIHEDYETLRLLINLIQLDEKSTNNSDSDQAEAEGTRVMNLCHGFEDIFTNTKLSKYGKIYPKPETSFLSNFYEVRMKALAAFLQSALLANCVSKICYKDGSGNFTFGVIKDQVNCSSSISEVLDSVIDEVDMGGPTGINFAMEFFVNALTAMEMNKAISMFITKESIHNFVRVSWAHLFEMRKTESFWTGLQNFVTLITHPYFCRSQMLIEYAEEFFKKGQLVTGIPFILVEKLSTLNPDNISEDVIDQILQICTRAAHYGNALHKTNRVTFSIFDYLGSSTDDMEYAAYGPNPWNTPKFLFNAEAKMRILGTFTIIWIQMTCKPYWALKSVVDDLLKANQSESPRQRIYFANSLTHRVKHRISQALLLLQPLFNEDLAFTVTSSLLTSLTTDCPQPSVRYYMEWIIMKNLLKYPQLHNRFFDIIKQCCTKRAGVATFVCSICFHVALRLNDTSILQNFCDKALRLLTNFLTGQHLTVRVYAQICFSKIFTKLAQTLGEDSRVLEKFQVIQDSLVSGSLTSGGNYYKMAAAMQKDFWLEVFDPEIDFNPEAIYIYIPKMSGMSYDEVIQKQDLTQVLSTFNLEAIREALSLSSSSASEEKYTNLKFESFHLKPPSSSGDGQREMDEINPLPDFKPSTETRTSLQRKINPWKILPVSEELLSDFPQELQLKKKSCSSSEGLIVVASLIDRIPNLGGLCRSCEIFGVSKYVISSLHLLDDPGFRSLSVTAHNWIDVIEVPPKDLESFLSTYTAQGYSILGIEQAIGSVSLNQYKFPKKAVLLLGNEKHGIPSNLLHLVDQCLEIPQVGVVRSLNVHVTGALCIWQYASQHII